MAGGEGLDRQATTLTVCVAADDPQEYRKSESFRSLAATLLKGRDAVTLRWVDGALDSVRLADLLADCQSRYVVFIQDGHSFSTNYVSTLVNYLESRDVYLADSYRYADHVPGRHNPETLAGTYHYRRDTDIWGTAFNVAMLGEFLQGFPGIDPQAVYVLYRLYYYINDINPLPVGYSTHNDTKNINGITLNPTMSRIAVPVATMSKEVSSYFVKLLINILRGLEGGAICPLTTSEMGEAARLCVGPETADIIPMADRMQYGALCHLADAVKNRSYLHKRLGDQDIMVEYAKVPPPADSTPLYQYQFSDAVLYSSKRYVKHQPSNRPDVIDHYRRKINPDSILLFLDRSSQADDNAEALYRYFIANYPDYKNAFFALSPKSPDWKRLALAGFRLVPMYSEDFYDKFLHADLVVSSQIYNIMMPGKDYSNSRFVYLQHGIMMNDMRQWIVSKCFDLFVATGEPEAAYLRSLAPRETINCGIPRLETVTRQPHTGKNILYMPTWRFNLGKLSDDAFMRSSYYQAIDHMLQDRRLATYLAKNDATLLVKIHPNFDKRAHLFTTGERVKISSERYSALISKSDFVFTDYSSVVLDAAYVGIPIAYYQFDGDVFFAEQPYTERMNYDTEGLGPVFRSEDDIIKYITKEAYLKPDPVFHERYQDFFKGVPFGKMRQTLCERMLEL